MCGQTNCWTSCISLSSVSFSHFQRRNKVAHCKSLHYCTSSRGHHPSTIPQFQNAKCQWHEFSSTSPTSFFYSTSRHSPRHAVLGRALRVESACHLVMPSRGDNRPLNATEGPKCTEHAHPPWGCSAPTSPPSRHYWLTEDNWVVSSTHRGLRVANWAAFSNRGRCSWW